jgi:hypothetical protein
MDYSMYEMARQWLAGALEIMYAELTPGYIFYSERSGHDEHNVVCVCSDCIYLQLTLHLEEYLELMELRRHV